MTTYTVHEPPPGRKGPRGPEDFRFVRDGFHFWALVLTPFWLLWRRLWLAFVLYVLAALVIAVGLGLIGVSGGGIMVAQIVLAIIVALEAGALQRRALVRRRWREVGIVSARSREDAERRFFAAWVEGEVASGARDPSPAAPVTRPPVATRPALPPGGDIVGLFPQPGTPR